MGNKFLNLAKGKGNKKTPTPIVVKKPAEKKVTNKPKSPAEVRDEKAKAKVEELLQDINLTPEKKIDLLEVDNTEERPESVGVEWLEEQLSLLTESNAALKAENDVIKADYSKIFTENERIRTGIGIVGGGEVQTNIINLFNELQGNYIQRGGELIIYPVAFMNRLIMFFPFLSEYKRF